jgi:hypothetical protein
MFTWPPPKKASPSPSPIKSMISNIQKQMNIARQKVARSTRPLRIIRSEEGTMTTFICEKFQGSVFGEGAAGRAKTYGLLLLETKLVDSERGVESGRGTAPLLVTSSSRK